MAGIAPIYGNVVCVAHYDEFLWVYTGEGDLRRKVSIPEIKRIWGVVAVKGKQGTLAVVDGRSEVVHFVTLSADLQVQQHTRKDVPLEANRISLSGQRQLLVSYYGDNNFAVLSADGDEPLHTVHVDIPDGEIWLQSTVQTKTGCAICDSHNQKVYVTDTGCHVVHLSTDWEEPRLRCDDILGACTNC